MNDTSTICKCYISIAYYIKALLILLCSHICSALVKWFIFFVFQFTSLVSFQYFVSFFLFCSKLSKYRIEKCRCHIIYMTINTFYLCVFFIRIYTKTNVRWKCPWSCCPCKNICIFIFDFKSHDSRTFFYILVSLRYFLCRKRGSTTRAVRNNLESFVKKSFIPNLLQSPPFRLNKVIVISYIWVFHISPESNCAGKILPHSFIFPYTFLTFLDKWFYPIIFNLVFSIQSKHLFNFKLNRKTMGIPSGLTRNHVTLHGTVSWNHVLDNTCQHMADMWFTICSRRTIIECISFPLLA